VEHAVFISVYNKQAVVFQNESLLFFKEWWKICIFAYGVVQNNLPEAAVHLLPTDDMS
jgi:hypothetical protein